MPSCDVDIDVDIDVDVHEYECIYAPPSNRCRVVKASLYLPVINSMCVCECVSICVCTCVCLRLCVSV